MNLGHTYAHALEKSSKYSRDLLHGEAVSIGICMACRLSSILGFLKINDLNEIEKILTQYEKIEKSAISPTDPSGKSKYYYIKYL